MKRPDYSALQRQYRQRSDDFEQILLSIPLRECGEGIVQCVDLNKNQRLVISDSDSALLRKSVADKLMLAADYFSKQGFSLRLESALRSLDEQRTRFIARYESVKKTYPQKSTTELLAMANTYTAGIPMLAAHIAGAAVDVTLLDKNGQLLDFGVSYRHGDIESITDYPYLSKEVKENRKLLKQGMEKFGFVNYPFEYWHYSIGDVCAAYLSGQQEAIFGPVNFDVNTHQMSVPKNTKDLYKFFDTGDSYGSSTKR